MFQEEAIKEDFQDFQKELLSLDTSLTPILPLPHIRNDTNLIELSNHPYLFNKSIAKTISNISTATRFTLKLSSLLLDTSLECLKFTTTTSLDLTRKTIINALSSAQRFRQFTSQNQENSNTNNTQL